MFRNFRLIFRNFEAKFSTKHENAYNNITDLMPGNDIDQKLLKVAVIGVPNAGKSTFINYLMDRKVCAVSSKVHTTRAKSTAIFTDGDSQIVFVDTPGLVNFKETKKYNLERAFLKHSRATLQQADIIGVIHDVSNVYTRERLDIKVISLLEEYKSKPSFLVFNKVDLLRSKRKLLDLTRLITENHVNGKPIPDSKPLKHHDENTKGWRHFRDIFMVSALTGSGLQEVKAYLIRNAKPAKWMFPDTVWTDQSAEEIIVKSVKAKLLDFLPQEIPYMLTPEIEFFNVNEDGVITSIVLVHCPSERIAKLVAGVSDGKLKQINESLQHDLQDTFQNFVRIKLILEAKK